MTERAIPEKLNMVKAHKLVNLLLDPEHGFTAMRLPYKEYAEFATQKLGFDVTGPQVATRVREFEIPAGEPAVNPDMSAMASMVLSHGQTIADLQERLARLEGWVNTTFPSKSPLKVVG